MRRFRWSHLLSDQQTVTDRQQQRTNPLVGCHLRQQSAHRDRVCVALSRIGHPSLGEDMVNGDQSAGTQQTQRVAPGIAPSLAVSPSRNTMSYAPSARRLRTSNGRPVMSRVRCVCHSRVSECLPCRPGVLCLVVDAGEDAVLGHTSKQPHTRDADAGANLGDVRALIVSSEPLQGRTGGRRHRRGHRFHRRAHEPP